MVRLTVLVAFLLCGVHQAQSFGNYREDIPNGERVAHPCKPNTFWKGVGHERVGGGGPRNQFGLDFAAAGHQWTEELCMKDSDGDGETNGQELGDPTCVWRKGSRPTRVQDITHPGVCTPYESSSCVGQNDWVDCSPLDYDCPATREPDTLNITLRFDRTTVPAKETTYKCQIFDVPSNADYHLIGYKAEIDNDNVMHHMIMYGCEDNPGEEAPQGTYDCNMGAGYGCNTMIGGWTVGVPGDCINENFGILIGKRFKRIALELHWNNPKLVDSWTDSSGLTLFYTPKLRPNNGAIMTVVQYFLEIPPGQPQTTFSANCSSQCTSKAIQDKIYISSAINHMHYLGSAMSVELRRGNRAVQYITDEKSYSYDNPTFFDFDPPVEMMPGDELITKCTFDSKYSDSYVYYGEGTQDEMCDAFIWFYPAENMPQASCNNWKSVELCTDRTSIIPKDGCNPYDFIDGTDAASASVLISVTASCNPDGHCHDACRYAVIDAKQHPCLKGGDMTDFVRALMGGTLSGSQFLRRLDMCDMNDNGPVIRSHGTASFATTGLLFVSMVLSFMGL